MTSDASSSRRNGYRVRMGGPSYRMETDARHTAAMIDLAVSLVCSGEVRSIAADYAHGTPVEIPRNQLLGSALRSEDSHLVWADSDIYWRGSERFIEGIRWLTLHDQPFLAVPCPQRDGRWNIRTDEELHYLEGAPAVRPTRCYAAGTGLCILNLEWYRQNWSKGPWFKTQWEGDRFLSEDIWHTARMAGWRRVACWYAALTKVGHAARGGGE